jgi:DNA-binding XRE family transcriptional regulator
MLSSRFRAMYRNLGLTRLDAAKLLHVSERTLHNWETGHHEIPYSAYRLLRLLTRQELPGKAWTGWHITAGVLWSPEGHGFKPEDSSWWSMLCRRSAQFHSLYEENCRLKHKDVQVVTALESVSVVKLPVTLHQSLTHETFPQKNTTIDCPANVRFARVSYSLNLLKGGV